MPCLQYQIVTSHLRESSGCCEKAAHCQQFIHYCIVLFSYWRGVPNIPSLALGEKHINLAMKDGAIWCTLPRSKISWASSDSITLPPPPKKIQSYDKRENWSGFTFPSIQFYKTSSSFCTKCEEICTGQI